MLLVNVQLCNYYPQNDALFPAGEHTCVHLYTLDLSSSKLPLKFKWIFKENDIVGVSESEGRE